MDEYFLQFLWKFQKFSKIPLELASGEPLTVFHTGHQNFDSGPDFLEAKIKVGELVWSGSVEIHYRSSDWYLHRHDQDSAYDNVVLHVVWSHDKEVLTRSGQKLPVFEMQHFVTDNLAREYRRYINQPGVILCGSHIGSLSFIQSRSMLDASFAARLREKGNRVLDLLQDCDNDWEETTYRLLAASFGFKTNTDCFEKLAKSLPFKILKKHLDHSNQVEALLFGMAGLLEAPADDYSKSLQQEFKFLLSKYRLNHMLSSHHWKFSRMRPANFPTVRLSQLAAMLQGSNQLFYQLMEVNDVRDAIGFIKQSPSPYWHLHYAFGKPSKKLQMIGRSSVENLIINAFVPLLSAYSKYVDDVRFIEKAEMLLNAMHPESNKIIKVWKEIGITPENAADSQALIYQYQTFCSQKRCLQCNIGISILNK